MTRRAADAVTLVALFGACSAAPNPSTTLARDSTVVASIVRERLSAGFAGDTARWHRLVSDDCLWTGPALRTATTREVLPAIVANRLIKPAAQDIRDLVVHLTGDVAQVTYVQLVQDAGQATEAGKRFRKTDTLVRRGGTWLLIGAAEVAVPFRARVALDSLRAERLSGRYAFGTIDTLTVAPAARGRFTLRGMDGTTDTLLAENDSTLFEEGDPGSWVFSTAGSREPRALVYQMIGAKDVMLRRVTPR